MDINDQVKKGDMPIGSYTIIHKDAVLSDRQRGAILAWTEALKDSIKVHYPADSILKK